jgi:hypothetical protein
MKVKVVTVDAMDANAYSKYSETFPYISLENAFHEAEELSKEHPNVTLRIMDTESNLTVGSAVRSTRDMQAIKVSKGELGWVFEDYGTGVQVIFENGGYCGFGNDELYLLKDLNVRRDEYANYEFVLIFRVLDDYRNSFWSFKL